MEAKDSYRFLNELKAEMTPKSGAVGKFNSLNPILPAFDDLPLSLIVSSTKRYKAQTQLELFDVSEDFQEFIKRRTERRNIAKPDARQQHSQKFEIKERVKPVKMEKSDKTTDFLKKILTKHFVFNYMAENEMNKIVQQFFYCEVEKDEYIFEQGDDATMFFILETGKLQQFVNKVHKSNLVSGASFGELALLYNTPRSSSVFAPERCGLWGIARHMFRGAVEEMIRKDLDQNRQFIEKVAFFKNMTPEQKDSISGILIKQKFEPGEFIIHDGDPADCFYIIKEGMVGVIKNDKEIRRLEEGDSFGESALLDSSSLRKFSVRTIKETICLALGRETVNAILGDKVQAIAFRNLQRWAFERNPTLSRLTKIQMEKVLDEMKISKKDKGQFIFRKDEKCNKIVIPLEGNLIYLSTGDICVSKGMAYGEKYMLVDYLDELISDDVVMGESGIITEIEAMDFIKVIGGPLPIILKKNEHSHEKKFSETKEVSLQPDIPLETLIFITKIGSGQFGSVYLVQDSRTRNLYALKCISRNKIISLSLEKHLQEEKRVLQSMAFRFIIEFVRTYKDDINIYFLTEYVKGMELFDVIRDIGLLTSEESQFYVGSMVLALEYMHNQDIVYRDMKPENVMIDHNGYPKLIDMGTCKLLKRSESGFPGRTFTIIGTPLYMAPEIIAGRGYSFYVDFWSIGVCLYEFMCGMVPFGETTEDPYEIYEEILHKTVKYPPYLTDKKSKSLMDQLLSKIPEARWGGSFAALKSHEWFEHFDWDKLMEKDIESPYIPADNRTISQDEIEEARKLNVSVVERISMNTPKLNSKQKVSYKELKPGLQDWDKEF